MCDWIASVRAVESATAVPPTAVMVSPATRPALAAALPDTVPAMVTPEVVVPVPVPVEEICAPRKAGRPIVIVLEDSPARILSAMLSALAIGMA
ncbi:hypothetical protein GCM10025867_26520 [Frondihabitans sucicola]|uniref:Response regulatory domain-containing protein n=1 Tax=Frondihabitans sucicola TaxID=1268041 RepID=A0ABM8GPR3_9MICO|nr:hypothetical protein GCM10025867_26520 [Frondihabitans sucicola]